jgi:quercetin dioxygenase-like cupin family protein
MTIYPLYRAHDWQALDYRKLIAEQPLAPDQAMAIVDLDRTEAASFHLVQVQTQEPYHLHRAHDATAILLEGRGMLKVGKDHIKMKAGDVVSIPRQLVHYYRNDADTPSVFYVIFTPPFEGKDRVVIEPSGVLQQGQ